MSIHVNPRIHPARRRLFDLTPPAVVLADVAERAKLRVQRMFQTVNNPILKKSDVDILPPGAPPKAGPKPRKPVRPGKPVKPGVPGRGLKKP